MLRTPSTIKNSKNSNHSLSNVLFLFLALLVVIGISLELYVSANRVESDFSSELIRAVNLLVFFTIWTNILVGVTSFFIARGKHKKNNWFWGLHLAGLSGIIVTLIIHRLYLAVPLTGIALLSDSIIHLLTPLLALCLWLMFGPRGKINLKTKFAESA